MLEATRPHESWESAPQSDRTISTIKIEVLGEHAHLEIWSRGGKAGKLVVLARDASAVIYRLKGPETTVEVVR